MSKFSERLKFARTAKGYSHSKLVTVIGQHRQSEISRWERGHRKPNIEAAAHLATALEVSLDWLAGLSDEGGPEPECVSDPLEDT